MRARGPPRKPVRIFSRLPALARFLLALVAINFVVFAAFRVAFWAAFHETLAGASRGDLIEALYLGSKFDFRHSLWHLLPLEPLPWSPHFSPARRRAARSAGLA